MEEQVINVTVADGKYTVLAGDLMEDFRALRYGEEWRKLTGDNLVASLAMELQEARDRIKQLEEKNK